MDTTRDVLKIRLHDGIVGVLYLSSIVMSMLGNHSFIYAAIGVAILQIISPITKFCPVYFALNKFMPDTTPLQNGK
jgi:hypothetical protein